MASGAARKRRRKSSPPAAAAAARDGRKLLVGEVVEVLSCDQGLRGSWHKAIVIGILENARAVRYTDFIDENGSPLVENVQVSDAIDGKSSMPEELIRGNIRPMCPHQALQVSHASYGLCVDALIESSYWEGVIADHAEGSMERKVLFPDEGDECIIEVDQLRLTQDWDEATGEWKPRGIWSFLQILLSHEERDGLPVSIRQIWFDLRSKPSFKTDAKMWMCGTEDFWERSLADVIAELWSLCDKPTLDGYQVEAVQKDTVETTVLDRLDPFQALSEYISCYRNNRKNALIKKEWAKQHLKSSGWTFLDDRPKNKFYISPDGKRFPSFLGACQACLAAKEANGYQYDHTENLHLDSMSLVHKNACYNQTHMDLALVKNKSNDKWITSPSRSWELVQLDAEFSPQIVSLLASYQDGTTVLQRTIDRTLSVKLKKHLLALGWSIKFKKDEIQENGHHKHTTRYRYESPYGKTYVSIIQVICSLIVGGVKQDDRPSYRTAAKGAHLTVSTGLARLNKRKRRDKTDALEKYIDYMKTDKQNSRRRKLLRSNAQKFLKSAGWNFWLKKKSRNKLELRYGAPHGKSYSSLVAACKGYLENGYQEDSDADIKIANHGSADGSMRPSKLIALSGGLKDSSKIQGMPVVDRCSNMFTLSAHHGKCRKRKPSSVSLNSARVLCSHGQIFPCRHHVKTVLSLLVEKNIVVPRDKVTYKRSDGPGIKEGSISRDGIKCMCCNELFTVENFEVHAGSSTPLPSAHMFLKDGRTIVYCDQCEREYHVGCTRNSDHQLICRPEGCWFCSRGCSNVFQHLQEVIGKQVPTPIEGLSCTILKFCRANGSDHGDYDDEIMAEHYGKLCIAVDILHECFVTIIEPRTQSDISEDIVFNRESELRRLNFRGFYIILLQKGGELVSVGTFRICGQKFAELPLIGTRSLYRRQGMCRLLINELEKLLLDLGVERLLLPAVPELLQTWTCSFGFTVMSNSERLELAGNSILSFQGTTMCQKILNVAHNISQDRSIPSMSNSERMGLAENMVVKKAFIPLTVEPDHHVDLIVEPELVMKIENNSSEEGISSIDPLTSMPDPQVGLAVGPEMVPVSRENKDKEGICFIDAPTCPPDPQVDLTTGIHEQSFVRLPVLMISLPGSFCYFSRRQSYVLPWRARKQATVPRSSTKV
ncbi:Acyl-CoA N-acyltransferase with RING/FYVE/PHD-type zinc finger domain [Zea mays]|uniref:Acyl-CoA N-acyltransferase with RING/FYVE/PHD-type zinc finger domain n=1 Tax=Zea mays TaxID=4577 RepID=A0A1D6JZB9_MAIZE|nr:Acyl-CoA N-acyltransferase with RING/FYVE/PHD-type zinc finger domain [Zea mays]